MTLGKISKTLNKWQFRFFIGHDPIRVGKFWRIEIWIFCMIGLWKEGEEIKKYILVQDKTKATSSITKMYRGLIIGRSYRIPFK